MSYVIPAAIVCCAQTAKSHHLQLGYCKKKMKVITNGFDFERFKMNEKLRERKRIELRINPDQFLIGSVARYSPQKDHDTFLRALKLLDKEFPQFHCVLIGPNIDKNNEVLRKFRPGLESRVSLLGESKEVSEIIRALDLHVLSSSYGEGFPNVLVEAIGQAFHVRHKCWCAGYIKIMDG